MTHRQYEQYFNNQLLACPFCGGKPRFTQWRDMGIDNCAWVECRKCGAAIKDKYNKTSFIKAAVAAKTAWNKRVI